LTHLVGAAGVFVADAGAGEREEGVFEGLRVGLSLDFGGRALSDELAVVDYADAVGNAVGLIHVVGGEEDGHPFRLVHSLDVVPELIAGLWVEAEGGLVEEQDSRGMEKAAGDFETALHAAGELLDLVVAALPELKELEELLGALAADFCRYTVEHAVDLHVLPSSKVLVERGVLKDDAEAAARFVLAPLRVETVKLYGAAGRPKQGGEHLDGGGFAGSVGAEEGENLAGGYLEGDVVDGGEGAEGLHEVLDADQWDLR